MLEKTFVVGPFQCNCRLFVCPKTGEAILVDPGDESELLIQELTKIQTEFERPIQIKYLLHTHGHLDHIAATRGVIESNWNSSLQSKPRIALHSGDEQLYLNLKAQGRLFGMNYLEPLPVDHYLQDGEEIQIGQMKLSIIHTPGHSPGSVCIRIHENSDVACSETLLTGDTLFKGSVGRTDLWGADQDTLFKSIRERILVLDDETRVCPGHGSNTLVGIEKRKNPFLI